MKFIIPILAILLTGCTTIVPVEQKWPDAPSSAVTPCGPLQKLSDDAKLSDVAKSVTANYTTYYECAAKTEAWIDWYNTQKQLRK
jgi:hypothetical protein